MPLPSQSVDTFTALPDPGPAGTLDDLVERLRLLKVWAGDPSYEWITSRVNAAWTAAGRPAGELARKTTVAGCFRPRPRRVYTDPPGGSGPAPRPTSGSQAGSTRPGQRRAGRPVNWPERPRSWTVSGPAGGG